MACAMRCIEFITMIEHVKHTFERVGQILHAEHSHITIILIHSRKARSESILPEQFNRWISMMARLEFYHGTFQVPGSARVWIPKSSGCVFLKKWGPIICVPPSLLRFCLADTYMIKQSEIPLKRLASFASTVISIYVLNSK